MKKLFCLVISASLVSCSFTQNKIAARVQLPNGWSLSPAGKSLQLGDLPLNIAVSPSKKYLAVTNNGESTQTLQLIDAVNDKVLDKIDIPKSWYGLKFSADERFLYASGGNDNRILKYAVSKNKLSLKDKIKLGNEWPVAISPTGFDIDESTQKMYVVTKEDNSLYVIDLKTKTIIQRDTLRAEAFTCLLSPDKKELYISLWGNENIVVYNTSQKKLTDAIRVGDHPNELCITKNGQILFVANANDNTVSVVNIKKRQVIETLDAALFPHSPTGSTTNGLALSEDEKTLYIANADNNCLAVFDVSVPGNSHSKGFIPVGWYPTCVRVAGNKIFVANGKGSSSLPNPDYDPFNTSSKGNYQQGDGKNDYIGGLLTGTLSIINTPSTEELGKFSRAVYQNTPYQKDKEPVATREENNPVPAKPGDPSPIKYVFYIIKENRTYDQVLGDMKEGNGDKSLVLFGENVTPNLHALAREFVLMDNFYVDGEVSEDGHSWSMGAYATDYIEKSWPTNYGGRGGSYDGEGRRLIGNNKQYLWDNCKNAGVSYRTYGEFVDDFKPNIAVLKGHVCPSFTGWDLSVRDTVRYGEWAREFDSLVAGNALPRFMSLHIGGDHTEGLRIGRPTPAAHVADNDLAVGLFVQHLSESRVWKESVVFILEDDAQNGPDHVDAHRSTVYVAGGYVKRHFVDHTTYSTSSVLRTIELILGLQPMSQYDAAATPMFRCFANNLDTTAFHARPLQVDINAKNKNENTWQRKSEMFDFSKEDRAPDNQFSEVIWKGVKGIDSQMPAPKHAAFIKVNDEERDGD
ncbi:MAG TPA: bifunctional YncE family protein/alkaline phosphatase family protein [Parafilimonas sp.]|nr:bifunctional YncE family protein/alkaline phosphatase family protein [Parafilimonas sp.]